MGNAERGDLGEAVAVLPHHRLDRCRSATTFSDTSESEKACNHISQRKFFSTKR
jgi:hypothetical protein